MTDLITEFIDGKQVARPATPEEQGDIEARRATAALAAQQAIAAEMDAYLDEVRDLRERLLNRLAGICAAAIVSSDAETQQAFVTARQRLLDITKVPGAAAAANKAELETAIRAEYLAIVASVPASLKKAFAQVDE